LFTGIAVFTILVSLFLPPAVAAQEKQDVLSGTWKGVVIVEGMELEVIFHIRQNANGNLSVTMDVPDQGGYDLAFDSASYKDGKLKLEMITYEILYEGKYTGEGMTIEGDLTQRKNFLS